MLSKLPIEVNRKIIIEFLFNDFIKCFKNLFEFKKWQSALNHNYYTFGDLLYSNFMSALVENLHPLKIEKNEMILSELDEVFDAFFVCNGQYDIGYEMNKRQRFIIRYTKSTVIGGFEVLYDRRSHYNYKAYTVVTGYFIRKKPFREMSSEYPEFIQNIRRTMLQERYKKLMPIMKRAKAQDLSKIKRRADFKQIITMRDFDEGEIERLVIKEFK